MPVPYENATSGVAARSEVVRILRGYGCQSIGYMEHFDSHEIELAFVHRGRHYRLVASAEGWAALWLRANPYTQRSRVTEAAHRAKALRQGMVAIDSVIRDWVKGAITAAECGIMPFDAAFMPAALAADGRPLVEHMVKLLPPPAE